MGTEYDAVQSFIDKISSSDGDVDLIAFEMLQMFNLSQLLNESESSKPAVVPEDISIACPLCFINIPNSSIKSHFSRCSNEFKTLPWSTPETHIFRTSEGLLCSPCKQTFNDFFGLKNHIKMKHKKDLPLDWTIYCRDCSLRYPSHEVFYNHHEGTMIHNHMTKTAFQNLQRACHGTVYLGSFLCNICCIDSLTPSAALMHVSTTHYGKEVYNIWCQGCDIVIPKELLQDHIRGSTHQSVPWFPVLCPMCGVAFVGLHNFVNHLKQPCVPDLLEL